jgi:hypothetical protein
MSGCSRSEPGTPHAKRNAGPDGLCHTCKVSDRKAERAAAKEARQTRCERAGDDPNHCVRPIVKRTRTGWLCNTCAREARAAHKAQARSTRLRGTYGIDSARYGALKAAQGGFCAVCGPVTGRNGNTKALAVDHRHVTPVRGEDGRILRWDGPVRGLLCSDCNQDIGRWRDDAQVPARAVLYLVAGSGLIRDDDVRHLIRVAAALAKASGTLSRLREIVDKINM